MSVHTFCKPLSLVGTSHSEGDDEYSSDCVLLSFCCSCCVCFEFLLRSIINLVYLGTFNTDSCLLYFSGICIKFIINYKCNKIFNFLYFYVFLLIVCRYKGGEKSFFNYFINKSEILCHDISSCLNYYYLWD